MQARGFLIGEANSLDPQRGSQRGRTVGVDQLQPRESRPAPAADPATTQSPTSAQAAKLVEKAFSLDDSWGTLIWLAMTTGMRRGEIRALRWGRIGLDKGILEVRKSYTTLRGVGREKDTKTHQMRRIALDTETTSCSASTRSAVRLFSKSLAGSGTKSRTSSPAQAATS